MWCGPKFILFVQGPFYITLDCEDTNYVCAGLSAHTSELLVKSRINASLNMFANQEHGRDEYSNLNYLFFLCTCLMVQASFNCAKNSLIKYGIQLNGSLMNLIGRISGCCLDHGLPTR